MPDPDLPPIPAARTASAAATWLGLAFVLVWCTGYIAGKQVVAHAAPFTALLWRFGLTALCFALAAGPARLQALPRQELARSAVAGVLMLALQFGGVYAAFALGTGSGVAALVIGAMPLLVAWASPWWGGQRLRAAQWLGMALGFAGVATVAADRIDGATPWGGWLALLVGLFGIAAGTLYQKRHAAQLDLRVGLAVQNAAATLVLLPLAAWEGFRFQASDGFVAAMAWLVLVNSIGGFALLFLLLRRGAATQVASLFFLMPPVTAVFGHVLLGEHLTALKLCGFALAALGVWLAGRAR